MLSWLFNRGATKGRKPQPAARMVRARFDAAQTTNDNRRHWANADALSANAAASVQIRHTLRNRARYEYANNTYCKGICQTLANDVIGTGPRLQLRMADRTAAEAIKADWERWVKATQLADKLRTMRISRAVDGEAFAIFTNNPKLQNAGGVTLDFRLVEPEQVTDPMYKLAVLSQRHVDGIDFDAYGNPAQYYVLKFHPGDTTVFTATPMEYDTVPAEQVIHFFNAERPSQARGLPDILASLPLFAQLRRFTLAVIAAAETAADFAGVIYTNNPSIDPAECEALDPVEIDHRTFLTLPEGWQMGQLKAEQPTTTYGDFKREILNEIARVLSMPYNIAAGNSSSYNYASGRMDHQTYYRQIEVERSQVENFILDRILGQWLREYASTATGISPKDIDLALYPHQWFWDEAEHVDPAKEATAQSTRLQNHTTTLAYEWAKQGLDWEQEIRQRAKEVKLMDELGLAPAAPPTAAPQPADDPTNDPLNNPANN